MNACNYERGRKAGGEEHGADQEGKGDEIVGTTDRDKRTGVTERFAKATHIHAGIYNDRLYRPLARSVHQCWCGAACCPSYHNVH